MNESEFMAYYEKVFNEMMAMAMKLANRYGYAGMPYMNNWKVESSVHGGWNAMYGK